MYNLDKVYFQWHYWIWHIWFDKECIFHLTDGSTAITTPPSISTSTTTTTSSTTTVAGQDLITGFLIFPSYFPWESQHQHFSKEILYRSGFFVGIYFSTVYFHCGKLFITNKKCPLISWKTPPYVYWLLWICEMNLVKYLMSV